VTGEPCRWVSIEVVLAIHDEQVAEHGGRPGLQEESLLLSALARPQNLAAHGEPDLADTAAAYAIGIACNQPFRDGNKRTAFAVSAGVFLPLNSYQLTASDAECVRVMVAVADGTMAESEFAAWLRLGIRRI
jgi:death on curing protein